MFMIKVMSVSIGCASLYMLRQGILQGGVSLTSCLTGLDKSVLQIKTKIVSFHTADSKPDKLEVNGTVILSPLVFPVKGYQM